MKLQISSGQGPVECELAVGKLAQALCEEFSDTEIHRMTKGYREGCYRSAIVESRHDLGFLDGSIKWICQSPFRPNHKRKNWFIDVSPIGEFEGIDFDCSLIRFETFRSSGKGGQNVNKVETGVRAIYEPLGVSAISTDERSQHRNMQLALDRLKKIVEEQNADGRKTIGRLNWLEHTRLVRGNPIRTYEGLAFRHIH